ncbi:hypothetical protein B0A48_10638 [Cryoendolithus antarcticus]|uniref:Uncharacterized protein n=1 Tax=Cryoendolithus antarcticus TaxID=1507870 RepID=A0A1V8SXV8_9PEZI|nr:hypothetical protein B0A48_10638 [Cryoendolithus antarcticus]
MSTYSIYDTYEGHQDTAEYSEEDGHLCLEMHRKDDDGIGVSSRTLTHAHIEAWLDESHPVGCSAKIRLLVLKPFCEKTPGRKFVPLSREMFGRVLEDFRLPMAVINPIVAHTTLAMDFALTERPQGGNPTEFISVKTRSRGIVLVLGPLAVAVSFDGDTGTKSAIVLGFCEHQASKLIEQIRCAPDVLDAAMLLPTIWIQMLGQTRAHRIMGRKLTIGRTEVDIGYHWSVDDAGKRLTDVKFDGIIRRLTVFGSETAWDMQAIDAQLEMATLLEEVQSYLFTDMGSLTCMDTSFSPRLRHIRQTLSGLKLWARDTERRIQVQLQTRDGVLMKQLAAQSKEVAARAWRDGVDMRVMAVITLVTLPATSTATLFSTSFFDFAPRNPGKLVSPWVWLYVAVTTIFTLLCLLGWYLASRAMTRRVEESFIDWENSTSEKVELATGVTAPSPSTETTATSVTAAQLALSASDPQVPHAPLSISDSPPLTTILSAESTQEMEKPDARTFSRPGRRFWAASDIWGTQSYKESGRACARCATPVD